jgi:hypothetical protein
LESVGAAGDQNLDLSGGFWNVLLFGVCIDVVMHFYVDHRSKGLAYSMTFPFEIDKVEKQ